jgi:hypothetical protein
LDESRGFTGVYVERLPVEERIVGRGNVELIAVLQQAGGSTLHSHTGGGAVQLERGQTGGDGDRYGCCGLHQNCPPKEK